MTGAAHFDTAGEGPDAHLRIFTAHGAGPNLRTAQDNGRPVNIYNSTRAEFEKAMRESLAKGEGYPWPAGEVLSEALGWVKGLAGLATGARTLRLDVSDAALGVLPEMEVITTDRGGKTWLDTQMPIYSALPAKAPPKVARHEEVSLAILYQDEFPFKEIAMGVQEDLHRPPALVVRSFSGAEATDDDTKLRLMQQVLFQYKAVLFLGHLHRNPPTTGWQLSSEVVLPFAQLGELLGMSRRGRVAIPDLVFSSSCSGAWGDPSVGGRPAVFYPSLFLDSGVTFFVGTWMDVVLSDTKTPEDALVLRRMVTEFFRRWAEAPANAVDHLFEAKRYCDFHLLTALYRIYRGPETDKPDAPEVYGGALVSAIAVSDRVGEYELVAEAWAPDPYARAFWARRPGGGATHLVQVLADDWQVDPERIAQLGPALTRLHDAHLSPSHLVPSRHETLPWSPPDVPPRNLHVLVYDREDEGGTDWSSLAEFEFDRLDPRHFSTVLGIGLTAGTLLAELHAAGIAHGNFDQRSVVVATVGEGRVIADDPQELLRRPTVMVKDAWVRQVLAGRTANIRYAAPEEETAAVGADQTKVDCWSLGVVLFELAVGKPPFDDAGARWTPPESLRDSAGGRAPDVPEALDRVVAECLMPTSELRVSAELLSRRLALAFFAGGAYVSALEQQLDNHVRAGHRLFALHAADDADVRTALEGLARRPVSGMHSYRAYEAAEGLGLIDLATGQPVAPWVEGPEYPPDVVGAVNFEHGVVPALAMLQSASRGETPVVWVRGADWWSSATADSHVVVARAIRSCQEVGGPVVIVSDDPVRLEAELGRSFVWLSVPPLSPSELFELLLAGPAVERLSVAEISPELAIKLAMELFPCDRRELSAALRVCALQHGAIDERLVDVRDDERARLFRSTGVASYVPVGALPGPEEVGLPASLLARVQQWEATLDVPDAPSNMIPRRVLITGLSGYGKTRLAQTLARRARRPLVRIEVSRCLTSGFGQSERILAAVLGLTGALGRALVLIDDLDLLFDQIPAPGTGDGRTGTQAAMARMASTILRWLEAPPPAVVAVLAGRSGPPRQWLRHVDLTLPLDEVNLIGKDESAAAYRASILAASLRRVGLGELAADGALMLELADLTNPAVRRSPLPSPVARRATDPSLRAHATELQNGADIEAWVVDCIKTLCPPSDPEQPHQAEFWLLAARDSEEQP